MSHMRHLNAWEEGRAENETAADGQQTGSGRRANGRLRREGHVVFGPHLAVGAGAADFHFARAFGMKEKRRAPAVAKFAGLVDRGMIGWNQGEPELVLAGKHGGNFGVGADRIAVAREVRAESLED